jgi:hypothetical protein
MPDFSGPRSPVVMLAVFELYRHLSQLFRRDVIEACDVDSVEIAAQCLQMTLAERLDAAMLTEEMANGPAGELVLGQGLGAFHEPEGTGLDDRLPESAFAANGAVALAGAFGQIQLALEADCAAVAAASILFVHA